MSTARFIVGDTREVVASLPDNSVDLVLTSPPFLALRSYLPNDDPNKGLEIGQEAKPAAFLDVLLELTAGWRRVLAPHGSIAIELGDTYSGSGGGGGDMLKGGAKDAHGSWDEDRKAGNAAHWRLKNQDKDAWPLAKSLALVPELYRVALAYGINPLTGTPSPAGRWRVRNVVRWHRPNPPVGALGDKFRPSTSDMVIACVSDRRWFDLDAVREEAKPHSVKYGDAETRARHKADGYKVDTRVDGGRMTFGLNPAGAPPLDTWVIPTHPFSGAHYATWPPALCVKPIKSMCPERVCTTCGEPSRRITETSQLDTGRTTNGSKPRDRAESYAGTTYNTRTVSSVETLGWTDCGCSTDGSHWRAGVVLDPFGGSGTTGAVATGLGRDAVLIDLDARNLDLARDRIGLFLEAS